MILPSSLGQPAEVRYDWEPMSQSRLQGFWWHCCRHVISAWELTSRFQSANGGHATTHVYFRGWKYLGQGRLNNNDNLCKR